MFPQSPYYGFLEKLLDYSLSVEALKRLERWFGKMAWEVGMRYTSNKYAKVKSLLCFFGSALWFTAKSAEWCQGSWSFRQSWHMTNKSTSNCMKHACFSADLGEGKKKANLSWVAFYAASTRSGSLWVLRIYQSSLIESKNIKQ
jgi:hypothetical protein